MRNIFFVLIYYFLQKFNFYAKILLENRPARGRTIWAIRHAEKFSDVDKSWLKSLEEHRRSCTAADTMLKCDCNWIVPSLDNTPLSNRGHQQADELGERSFNSYRKFFRFQILTMNFIIQTRKIHVLA